MFSFRRMAGAGAASLALVLGLSLTTATTAQASPMRSKMLPALTRDLRAGDCTLFHGATVKISSNGQAEFHGVVTSSHNRDAYLLWVHLRDRRGAEFYLLRNADVQNPRDPNEFIRDLPDHRTRYIWSAYGTFNPRDYARIDHVALHAHC